MSEGDEGLVRRWSRLKRERRSAVSLDESAAADGGSDGVSEDGKDEAEGHRATAVAVAAPAGAAPVADENGAPALDLPAVESLDLESDFSAFMKEGVPRDLQRLALRKLWRLDPAFNFVDGLDDYAEDYSKIGIVAVKISAAVKSRWGVGESDGEGASETADAPGSPETSAEQAADRPAAADQPARADGEPVPVDDEADDADDADADEADGEIT